MISIESFKERLRALEDRLDVPALQEQFRKAEQQAAAPNLWDNQDEAVKVLSDVTRLQNLLSHVRSLDEWATLESIDDEELAHLEEELSALEMEAIFSGEHDRANAILAIHAGTGGVDAQDWAEMLQRMYLRFIEAGKTEPAESRPFSVDRTDWSADVVELARSEEAGIKRAVIEVRGNLAYGLLKAEAGVHRLVRLSPFNAKNLRQTSFALVEVLPEIEQGGDVEIPDKDLRIDVFRAGGHGGQGVNTTDSAVRITHLPSGIVVSVQNERSQLQNKATAMRILRSRLELLQKVQSEQETAMLKGEFKEGSWGNQIRSYVLQPYQMVKDHRTETETSNVQDVLDGNLAPFIQSYLQQTADK